MTTETANRRLSAEALKKIDHWVAKFPPEGKRSAIIQALMIAQEHNGGWLSPELIDEVSDYLGVHRSYGYEVATFYSMFDLEPAGRHKVAICNNISCMLRGSEDIIAHAEKKLGIKRGESTADGRVKLHMEEECLAACCGAPMMIVDGHYHENLTPERVDEILDGLD
jgi:NADH-quinone oxidoreductase subunit E